MNDALLRARRTRTCSVCVVLSAWCAAGAVAQEIIQKPKQAPPTLRQHRPPDRPIRVQPPQAAPRIEESYVPSRELLDDVEIADTKRPSLLFETGLPTRYYMPNHDARMDLLEHSDTVSRCPYKGEVHHYSVRIVDKLHKDVVWSYRYPAPDSAKVQGLLGFLNEKLDIYEDGKLLPRPKSPWS